MARAGPGTRSRTSRSRAAYTRGTVAMARTPAAELGRTRSSSSSSTTRRPIALEPTYNNYQIIGNVTSGMEVVGRDRRRGGHGEPDQPGHHDQRDRRATRSPHPEQGAEPMTSATIATDIGDIEVDLYDESAPKAAANFVELAKQGLLRRRDLPPGHPGLRDPGRRRRVRQEGVAPDAAGSGPAARATSSRTSRSRATTSAARWRWPTRARTRTARSSSSATRT